jgi:hypothetical protein
MILSVLLSVQGEKSWVGQACVCFSVKSRWSLSGAVGNIWSQSQWQPQALHLWRKLEGNPSKESEKKIFPMFKEDSKAEPKSWHAYENSLAVMGILIAKPCRLHSGFWWQW